MNVRGERIIIFGDSLTAQTSAAPSIWDVNQSSNRSHSAPGSLLASLLMEQGAQAVRTNARVSRSAWNFWQREGAKVIENDIAFRPTKVIVMLGTNDVGLDPVKDHEAFTAIRDAYKAMGAEVWAIGPFISSKPVDGTQTVVNTMKSVFGQRFIDGRPLSELAQHTSDGLHYTPAGARVLALALADAVLTKPSPAAVWGGLAAGLLGVGLAIGVGLWWIRRGGGTTDFLTGADEDEDGHAYDTMGHDGEIWRPDGDVIDAEFTEVVDEPERKMLAGIEGVVEIVNGKRFDGNTNELIRKGYKEVPCKSGLDEKGLARCWSKRGLSGSGDTKFKIGDLPRDMREELFNLHATAVDPEATEKQFNRRSVPMTEVDVAGFDVSGYSEEAVEGYDPEELPPIVIANGKLVDGGHRVAAAQNRGIQRLKAIDMTGLIDPEITGAIAGLESIDDDDVELDEEAIERFPKTGTKAQKDAWWEELRAKSEAKHAKMREALAAHDAVFITSGDRRILLLKTPEMSNPEEGSIRVTQFDADGPIGHMTRHDIAALAKTLSEDWQPSKIEPATEAEVMAFTDTDRFREGSERVAAVQRANAGLKGNLVKSSEAVRKAERALERAGWMLKNADIDLVNNRARIEVARGSRYVTLDVRNGQASVTREEMDQREIAVGRRGDRARVTRIEPRLLGRERFPVGGVRNALRFFADYIDQNGSGELVGGEAFRALLTAAAEQRANAGLKGDDEQKYRVAYGLVVRRDGEIKTVRAILDAPRALTRAEAEKWRRKHAKQTGNTTWIETVDGEFVPVTGAKKFPKHVDGDQRPGEVHATIGRDV